MRTRAEEKRRFVRMVIWFYVGSAILGVMIAVPMLVLKALGVISPSPPVIASAADAGDDADAAAGPLTSLAVTFHESSADAGDSHELELAPDGTLACTHAGATATTKTCAYELAPFQAAVTATDFASALTARHGEVAGAPRFDLHVSSSSVNVDAKGTIVSTSDFAMFAPVKAAIVELEKLCLLADAPTAPFEIVYAHVEQGGTAGKREIFEVRSDGAVVVKDAASRPTRSGTAPAIELAPLARLVARPELAALGRAYVDPTPPPSMAEEDYDLTISKSTTLKGVFHDKTPRIIVAIAQEIARVASLAR